MLAVVGTGLVSPTGRTAAEHVFFLRAGAPPPPVSPFLLADDRRLRVFYCPWMGAHMPVSERLVELAFTALDEALAPLAASAAHHAPRLLLVVGAPRPGLTDDEIRPLEEALRARLKPVSVERFRGEAGAFAAIERLHEAPPRDEPVVLLAVDSMITLPALLDLVVHPHSPWQRRPPHPSEAAAAIVFMNPARARAAFIPAIGFVDGAATAHGGACDDNDEIVDGAALTSLISRLPLRDRVALVFGQHDVDSLRLQEWVVTQARAFARFRPDCDWVCFEADVGRVGAASGAASIVYGLSTLRHGTATREITRDDSFLTWAVSSGGLRGAAAVRLA
jgi:hypothetical protein